MAMRWPVTTAFPGPPPTATSMRSFSCWQPRPPNWPRRPNGQGRRVLARDPGREDHRLRPVEEPSISVTGEVINLWYSGKAHAHGGNIQAVTAPDGLPLWVSDLTFITR